jgi:hypothetical protein
VPEQAHRLVQRIGYPYGHRVGTEVLDEQVAADQRQPEGQQRLREMAAPHQRSGEHSQQRPGGPGQRRTDGQPEEQALPGGVAQLGARVSADGVQRAVAEVQHTGGTEGQAQTGGDDEEQQPVGHAVDRRYELRVQYVHVNCRASTSP